MSQWFAWAAILATGHWDHSCSTGGLLSETSKRGPTIGTDFLNVSNSRLHNNDNLLPFDGRTQAPVNALSKNPCRAISAAFVTSPFISIYPRAQWTILTAHWSPRADLITFIIEIYSCSKRLTIDTKESLALIKPAVKVRFIGDQDNLSNVPQRPRLRDYKWIRFV